MSLETLRKKVETQFSTSFGSIYPTTVIKYDNVPFNQPNDAVWVALSIMEGNNIQANLGLTNVTERASGIVQIDVLIPEDNGTSGGYNIVDDIGRIFSRKDFLLEDGDALTFKAPSFVNMGLTRGFFRISITFDYIRDATFN